MSYKRPDTAQESQPPSLPSRRFKALTKMLASVPKKEIDEKAKEHQRKKRTKKHRLP